MNFQIHALPEDDFTDLFTMSEAELAERNACRMVVQSSPGSPCRVSMADAEVGETVVLINYAHQPENSPYQATHAIFVREGAKQARLEVNEVPEVIRRRLISLRLFDHNHMMINADVLKGEDVEQALSDAFDDGHVAYAHLHNAKPGCFAAHVSRVP